MNWAPVAVALGGLAALLTVLLAYRSRFSPYQTKLWEKQLDAVTEVLQTLGRYHDEGLGIADGVGGPDAQKSLVTARAEFVRAYRRWHVVIPQPLTESVTLYLRTIDQVVGKLPEDGGKLLAEAYATVVGTAQRELRVKTLSDRTLSSIESLSTRPSLVPVGTDPMYIKATVEKPFFRGFTDESGTGSQPDKSIAAARDRVYVDNRNLFLTHVWRPSEKPGQVADISIRLAEHQRHGGWPAAGRASTDQPLSDGLVERVEYYLGSSFRRVFVRHEAANGFRLNISAYGPTLCIALVHFTDRPKPLQLQRYLDFIEPEPPAGG
ncbi:pYEATS domain-containing protein [Actinoplanes sp. NPDC051861]|uniref:pYEATS domain-containing protein n=1 Tax=Actinoplanes sp. NPDC051861 TaxID=3155170 RepID=UPI00341701FF